ncbi:MAG: amidohydrolase [Flammeovirgaceae bacterium]|nr:amidohydrolase [Flammeovirgaceae bacterium]MBR10587.1 amidohydrolase [Rickettsiales bacterium]HCX23376.1 amidohydrolase [Cytophagales bacterium]|tara:strand:- start:1848 stop:3278 length:1431 start_codon:yes stop_codon:yes gene_type:complete
MKLLKYIGLGFIAIVLLIVATLGVLLLIDNQSTAYLNVDNLPSQRKSYLIEHVNVIPMSSDTVLMDHSVKVVDGVIVEIGTDLKGGELDVIDGKGQYLSPGLIDMHVHVWDEYELGLYLANGVTAVRNLWGQPMHLRMKEAINNGEIVAPAFYTSGPKLTGPEFIGDDNLQLFEPEAAKAKIKEYHERGYDLIKTYYGLTPEIYDAVVEQCKLVGMDIAAHPSQKVAYSYHFQSPIKTIEHAEDIVQLALDYQLDSARLEEVVDLYASHPETALCPTLVVYYNIYRLLTEQGVLNTNEMDGINPLIRMTDSPAQLDRWQGTKAHDSTIVGRILAQHNFQVMAVKKLHEAGATIVCGTDAGIGVTPAGYSIHQELQFYKEAGMTDYEALKTATVNASGIHRFLADKGSVEVGKVASFNLTSGNPLQDISTLKRPNKAIVNGLILDRDQLDEYESRAKERSNLIVSGMRYLENLMVEK